jgi:hypothetical protein
MQRPLMLKVMDQIVECTDELRLRRVVEHKYVDCVNRQLVLKLITLRGASCVTSARIADCRLCTRPLTTTERCCATLASASVRPTTP